MEPNFIVKHAKTHSNLNFSVQARNTAAGESGSEQVQEVNDDLIREYLNRRQEFERMERFVASARGSFFCPPK